MNLGDLEVGKVHSISGRRFRVARGELISLLDVTHNKISEIGKPYFWVVFSCIDADGTINYSARCSFYQGSGIQLEREGFEEAISDPSLWRSTAEEARLIRILPSEWVDFKPLDAKQFIPRHILGFVEDTVHSAVDASIRRWRIPGERGGAGPGWNSMWDGERKFAVADEVRPSDDFDWERAHFDAMTDGQLGDYEDFSGDTDQLGDWAGR